MIEHDPNMFYDPRKSNDDYWDEDPTREPALCELWQETPGLYDKSQRSNMTEDKETILMRFSTILKVPRELHFNLIYIFKTITVFSM